MGRYKAILFDIGGTLVAAPPDPHAKAVEAISDLDGASAASFLAAVRIVVDEWRAEGGSPEVEDLRETWIEHNRRALTRIGYKGNVSVAARAIEDVFLTDGLTVYADVGDTLGSLAAAGYELGVVSNWPATLDATLESLGLRQYFSIVVASGCVGYAKPHPQIFKTAIEQIGVRPEQALYVGDSIDHDWLGARGVGIEAVLVDRGDRLADGYLKIRSLSELAGMLR